MNLNSSTAAEIALRKQVERAVRPLRATEQRKLRMREELLAHLTGIYVEERERQEEPAALTASFARFGSPAELTAELNRSVGSGERWAWVMEQYEQRIDRYFSKGDNETLVHYVLRAVLGMAALTILLLSPVYGVAWATGGLDDPITYSLLAKLLPLMFAYECTALFAALAVDRLAARQSGIRRWLNLLAQSLVWSALLLLAFALFWWSISHRPPAIVELARLGLSIGATIAGLLVIASFACNYSRRRKQLLDAWRLLDLDA